MKIYFKTVRDDGCSCKDSIRGCEKCRVYVRGQWYTLPKMHRVNDSAGLKKPGYIYGKAELDA